MTLQKNSSNATRKRKFQEQSENQAISTTTTTNSSTTNNNSSSRQQLQIQTEFQILQSLIPGLANQEDISEVGVTFKSSHLNLLSA